MSHRYALMLWPLVAAAVAYGLGPLVGRFAVRIGAVDHPDPRKIHRHAMPRLGGLAVIVATGLTLGISPLFGGAAWAVPPAVLQGLLLGLIPILGVSIVDDIHGVPARWKFLCHLLGATLAVASGISLPHTVHLLNQEVSIGFFAIPISIIWLAGVTNAFNIIDGLDGLAAGLAFISSVAVTAVFITSGQPNSAIIPSVLAGAIAGFLPYNLFPARMFLGDTGATAIGFALAVIALKGGAVVSAGFAAATPVLILGLPIADTLVAIVRRLVRRAESRSGGVFQPDSNHVHHRLLALGLNQRNAVLVLYGLGIVTAGVAYVSLFLSSRESALLLLTLLIAAAIGFKRLGYDEFALLRRGTILRFYEAPVLHTSMFVAFVDIAFVCLSAYLAVALKTDDWFLRTQMPLALRTAAALVPLTIIVFWNARLYEGSWRLATMDDYVRAARACGIVTFLAIIMYSWQFENIPASVIVIDGLVNALLVVGSRASYRVLVSAHHRAAAQAGTPVLIYGPTPDEFMRARDLIDRAGSFGFRPVGFVTESGEGTGRVMAGLKIYGPIGDVSLLAKAAGAEAVVLARRGVSDAAVREFVEHCRRSAVVAYRLNTELEQLGLDDLEAPVREELAPQMAAGIPRTRESNRTDGLANLSA